MFNVHCVQNILVTQNGHSDKLLILIFSIRRRRRLFRCYGPRAVHLIIFCLWLPRFDTVLYLVTFFSLTTGHWNGMGKRTRTHDSLDFMNNRLPNNGHKIQNSTCSPPLTRPFLCKHTNINRHLSNLVRSRRKPPPLLLNAAHKFRRSRHSSSSSGHTALSNGKWTRIQWTGGGEGVNENCEQNESTARNTHTHTEYAEKTFCGHRNMVELLLIYEFGGKGSHESWS